MQKLLDWIARNTDWDWFRTYVSKYRIRKFHAMFPRGRIMWAMEIYPILITLYVNMRDEATFDTYVKEVKENYFPGRDRVYR